MARTDELLFQMIPKAVAERIRKGESYMDTCEVFPSVTMLFSGKGPSINYVGKPTLPANLVYGCSLKGYLYYYRFSLNLYSSNI